MIDTAIPILPARDLDATAAMYERLGFAVSGRWDDYLILERDGVELHVSRSPDLDPATAAAACYLRVGDGDRWHADATAAGLELVDPDELRRRWDAGGPMARRTAVEDRPWGLREFALFDLDNTLLRIGQPIG